MSAPWLRAAIAPQIEADPIVAGPAAWRARDGAGACESGAAGEASMG